MGNNQYIGNYYLTIIYNLSRKLIAGKLISKISTGIVTKAEPKTEYLNIFSENIKTVMVTLTVLTLTVQ